MKVIILCFAAIFINGCNSGIIKKQIIDNTVVYGKVKTISQTMYNVKERFGEMQKVGLPSQSLSYFNEKTNLIKDSISNENASHTTIYRYDSENKIIEEFTTNYLRFYTDPPQSKEDEKKRLSESIDKIRSISISNTTFEYSNSNKRKEIFNYEGHTRIWISQLDNENKRTIMKEYENDGSLSKTHSYSYNSKGNLIEEVVSNFVASTYNTYLYDKNCNLLQKKVDGLINVIYSYENFDNQGNWLRQKIEVLNLKPNYDFSEFFIYGNWKHLNFPDNNLYINERKIEYYN